MTAPGEEVMQMPEKALTVGSLFSGIQIGGFDLGLERTGGFTAAWFCEQDPYCTRVLNKHWPGVPIFDDIREVHAMPASKLSSEQYQQAVRDYEDGMSVEQIADHLPVTRQALWERFKRNGVQMRPHVRFGADNHFYRGGVRGSDWAHNKVEKAVKRGELVRPTVCSECGGAGQDYRDGRSSIQAHHDDYNKPLDVRWLCQPCHHEWHKHNEPVPLGEVMPQGSLPPVDVLCGGFPRAMPRPECGGQGSGAGR